MGALKLPKCNGTYGAPMGRHSFGIVANCEPRTVRLARVELDSCGYDNGGAYWGLGAPLYAAIAGDHYRQFVRAYNREHAALMLELPDKLLQRPVGNRYQWRGYDAQLAHVGGPEPLYVVDCLSKYHATLDFYDLCQLARETFSA